MTYFAVFFDDDKKPSKPFTTFPVWLESCK